jgi:hypothetical protein
MPSERDAAAQRLNTALVEREGLRKDWLAIMGTSGETRAYARYRVTSEEIAALQEWLEGPTDEENTAGGRIWLDGREVDGTGALYPGLENSHD